MSPNKLPPQVSPFYILSCLGLLLLYGERTVGFSITSRKLYQAKTVNKKRQDRITNHKLVDVASSKKTQLSLVSIGRYYGIQNPHHQRVTLNPVCTSVAANDIFWSSVRPLNVLTSFQDWISVIKPESFHQSDSGSNNLHSIKKYQATGNSAAFVDYDEVSKSKLFGSLLALFASATARGNFQFDFKGIDYEILQKVPRFPQILASRNQAVTLVDICWLKAHEEIVSHERVAHLRDAIREWKEYKLPLLVDAKSGAILDGHHRYAVGKEMGLSKLPVILVDYLQDNSITVDVWPDCGIDCITKEEVIDMSLSDHVFPPKTSRHEFVSTLAPISVPLEKLQ